jgi:hypothetical protein
MTLDEWIKEIEACAQDNVYFEISGEDAGDLLDQIKHLKGMWKIEMRAASGFYAEVKRLREILKMWVKFWEADGDDVWLAEEAMESTRDALEGTE